MPGAGHVGWTARHVNRARMAMLVRGLGMLMKQVWTCWLEGVRHVNEARMDMLVRRGAACLREDVACWCAGYMLAGMACSC